MYPYDYLNQKDYLCHHGILGQKWGIRRFQNGDGSLTAAGKERYSKENGKKTEIGMAPEVALFLAVYAVPTAVIATTSAASIAVEAVRHKSLKNKIEKERAEAEKDPKTGLLLKKDKDMSEKDDMKRVNPDYMDGRESQNNCMLCTTAYDMRRRGYEVTAKKVFQGFTTDTVKKWYPKAKVKNVSTKDENGDDSPAAFLENTKKALLNQGEGARGNLMNRWAGSYGGHSIVYEVKDNKVILRDCQTNSIVKLEDFVRASDRIDYARLDNVDFDPKKIKEAVR